MNLEVVDGEGPGHGAVFAWTGRSPRGSHKSWVVVLEAFLPLKPVQYAMTNLLV